MKIIADPRTHLKQVNESYVKHGSFAVKWGGVLIFAGLVSIIHGIFPFIFPFTVPKLLEKVMRAAKDRGHREA